jgi:hypothetical protein
VGPVAVLTVEERGMIRVGLENRFARELEGSGQVVVRTHELLSLSDIREDRQASASRLLEAGARAILITRLVSSDTRSRSFRAGPEQYAPVTTGYSPGLPYGPYDWYGYYTVAVQDMSTVWSSQSKQVYLETSLFDLAEGKRLWSCLTDTVIKESTDRLTEMDQLAKQITDALRKDGLVK